LNWDQRLHILAGRCRNTTLARGSCSPERRIQRLAMAPQIMPNWWFYLFAGWTVVRRASCAMGAVSLIPCQMGMGGLMYQHLATPAAVFAGGYPKGYDAVADGLASTLLPGTSPRLEYLVRSAAGCTSLL
jgi:hypothetical protein